MLNHWASQFWQFFGTHCSDWSFAEFGSAQVFNGDLYNPQNPAVQRYYFLADYFASSLSSKSLIDRLKEIYGANWKREIERNSRQTAPFWNYNLSRYGDRIRNNLQDEPRLVGYGEQNQEAWAKTVSDAVGYDVNGVNNNNPHEMIFLITSHGLPLFALRPINQTMRTAYQYLMRMWNQGDNRSNPIPVHISTVWEKDIPALDPVTAPEDLEVNNPADFGNGHHQETEDQVQKL